MADFTIYAGESAIIKVPIVTQSGGVKNMVGSTISFRIGDTRAGTNEFIKAGTLTNGGTDGIIQVRLEKAETILFSIREWDYQFLATDHDGDLQNVKSGLVKVKSLIPAS